MSTNTSRFAISDRWHIFVATGVGTFRSMDNGENWIPIDAGLTTSVRSFAINPKGYIFAGTYDGVYRSIETTTSVKEPPSVAPASFALEQNYPNPFNPATTISFSISYSSYVTLKVYNTLGEEVATLVAANLSAGRHQAVWDASGIAGGVYFYRLQAGGLVQTKKLIVVR